MTVLDPAANRSAVCLGASSGHHRVGKAAWGHSCQFTAGDSFFYTVLARDGDPSTPRSLNWLCQDAWPKMCSMVYYIGY